MGEQIETALPSLGASRPHFRPANTALNMLSTSYKHNDDKGGRSPSWIRRYGTSISARLKPAVHHSSSLDLQCKSKPGALSHFQRQFQQLGVCNGTYTKVLPSTIAHNRERGTLQLHTPERLRALSSKTEYRCSYVPQRPTVSVCRNHQMVGRREESGFTEGHSLQPYTFLPLYVHMARPTHSSVTRMDFLPTASLQGNEMLPKLVSRSPRENAFTRDTRDLLTGPASLLEHPGGHRQKISESAEKTVGLKENSGFVLNTPTLNMQSHTPPDPLHFLTHYQSMFCDPEGLAAFKVGMNRGEIQTQRDSGYSGRDTDRFILCGY
ncbi:stabilizer of axonemal microtubules 4 isoform X1 [Hoplias malabaricus]|uniref:stabilizer of axonemal microtubules 4 isoform X1 n=1 Tax=Hoplias malabaricus TaxID=27720 RepID=UPI003461E958